MKYDQQSMVPVTQLSFLDIRMCGENVTKSFFEHLILHSFASQLIPFDLWCFPCYKTTVTALADAKL